MDADIVVGEVLKVMSLQCISTIHLGNAAATVTIMPDLSS
jgi:hypothetical protein